MTWKEPAFGEVRQAGLAIFGTPSGYVLRKHSCKPCADVLRASWVPSLEGGVCAGCECMLEP